LREPAARVAGHDTATLKAFQGRLGKSAAVGAGLPIDSRSRFLSFDVVACRFLAVSLRLNAKSGIVPDVGPTIGFAFEINR
jgi:hypothetical protein